MQPYPRAPDLVWPGQLHGTGCLSARALDTGFATVVWCLCLGWGCGWVWVSVTPPALAGVLGGCVWVQFVVSSLFCRLGFVVFVVGLGFLPAYGTRVVACALCLQPVVSCSGVWCGRACWGLGFGCAPSLLGGVFGCVCARAPVPCGLLHLLAGGAVRACVFVRAPCLFPCLSWLGCAVWACVLGPGLRCAPLFLVGLSWCVFFFRFRFVVLVAGCPCPGPCGPCPPIPLFRTGLLALSFFFVPAWCVSARFGYLIPRWPAAPGLVLPAVAGWSPCAPLGVPSLVPSGWGVWPPFVVMAGGLVAVGRSLPPPPVFFF